MTTPPTASTTMHRAVAEPLSGVRLETADVPTPAAGQVLVQSVLVGICGSDIHAIAGHHPFLASTYLPGHEATGVVAALGEGVEGVEVGQRVLLKPNVACGTCLNCRAGRSNACERLSWIGCDPSGHWAGAMAEYFVAPAGNLYAVPDSVDDETAALVECLATPVHAARIAGDLAGARVVVLGAGTIGVLCVVAALNAGAGTVVATDLDEGKLARATRIGAHGAVKASDADANEQVAAALGGPADVVLDCVANERSYAQAVSLLRRAGTLVVVGVPARDAVLPMPIIQDFEIRVQGCAAYTEADVETAISIAVDGGLPTAEVVSGRYSLEDISDAFTAANADSTGKLLVSPRS
ncbi:MULTISPECIES: zinc-binding dehydrogenase [unclassified Rathayibacter]|uniref:zinc-dependent alcohol dehydrogenase n=1 Tax=unclassified Rathayibacter TaxID=2609250 RepID=UPI001FB52EDA|nr:MULTISPECIES: alcohol dehydrogenase catalytic domain-containing protein [unclassified Rathayibacter]MCJ1674615.1 alcohol dehydrogenase catalytic domain-containing protein [Rathayibacter sp. VKM Ac-2929]MCJ1684895.1 alcohol dehydrogenase catalytic domain-containing protein [Rathayibacter sp. VKM Ac-2928]